MLNLPEMQNYYIHVLFIEHYIFEDSTGTFEKIGQLLNSVLFCALVLNIN